jgi:hypothetical protein
VLDRRTELATGGVDGDADDQERCGDREDAVGEELQPGGLQPRTMLASSYLTDCFMSESSFDIGRPIFRPGEE